MSMRYWQTLGPLLIALLAGTRVLEAASGVPICAPGLLSCGLAGCYTRVLTACNREDDGSQAACRPIRLLQSVLNRFRQSNHSSLCPTGYANACGDVFCAMNQVIREKSCTCSSSAAWRSHSLTHLWTSTHLCVCN